MQRKLNGFSIHQRNRYPFSRALIGFRNSRYPKLLVDFEAKVKMTGSTHAENSLHCIKVHFYPIILVNTKTTIPDRGRFASRYVFNTTHLPLGG